MGFYTSVSCEALLTSLGVSIVKLIHGDLEHSYWKAASEAYPQYEFLKTWSQFDRCDFIPFGTQCVIGAPSQRSELIDNVWKFDCSLKNYNSEIENFEKYVLPMMVVNATIKTVNDNDYECENYVLGVDPK
jgi:hypothetical protein